LQAGGHRFDPGWLHLGKCLHVSLFEGRARWRFLATLTLNRVVLWSATIRASSAQARARPLPSWGCSSSPCRSSTRTTRTPRLGKAGWKLRLQLSKQKAESRLRVNFGCGLLSPTRPRRSAPREHPECRAATCLGPRHRGFLWQRPWSGMGGHRNNPAGMRRTRRLRSGRAGLRGRGLTMAQPLPGGGARRRRAQSPGARSAWPAAPVSPLA
jgi:hypothetical protein